ncbi:MAG TPA: hypothetical protein VFW40_14140 [Capsulimonadaceae bacterium]|nr:hypothetical protein [Capsulimonadaceae bacterium]
MAFIARNRFCCCLILFCCLGWRTAAHATTKGLNQIVTPDIQPQGVLSVSLQQEDPTIGNRYQVQLEQGITKRFEVAYFQGFSPDQEVFATELGLLQKPPYLLSTGFLGWSSNGIAPQPFLEGGYYQGNWETIAGVLRAQSQAPAVGGTTRLQWATDTLAGAAYRLSPRLSVQMDYQSGSQNFATAGFTYNITSSLSLNPAVYISNSTPHKGYGYAVLTWNIQAFK